MLGIPIIIGTSLEQINSLIDRTVASGLGSGSITILNYATKLNGAMLSLSVIAILSILYPKFSRLVSENNIKELKVFQMDFCLYKYLCTMFLQFF